LCLYSEELIRDGLHPAEIIEGYEKALKQTLTWLEELIIPGSETLDLKDRLAVADRIKGTLSSKQFGYEDILAKTCAEACIDVCPKVGLYKLNPVESKLNPARPIA
jgi:T-complex protein 1 subunit theta